MKSVTFLSQRPVMVLSKPQKTLAEEPRWTDNGVPGSNPTIPDTHSYLEDLQMAFGSEMVTAWQNEIDRCYGNRRVYDVEGADSWTALSLSRKGEWLFLCWDHSRYGCCLATTDKIRTLTETAGNRPPILASLKKHLNGARITDVEQINRDRVLQIRFSKRLGAGKEQETALILEAAGSYSNLILTTADGTILEAAHHVHPEINRYRSVLPGQPYVPPPPFPGLEFTDLPTHFDTGTARKIKGIGKKLGLVLENIMEEGNTDWKNKLHKIFFPNPEATLYFQSVGNYITVWPEILPDATFLPGTALETSAVNVIDPVFITRVELLKKKILKRMNHELHRIHLRLEGMAERISRGEKAPLWNHQGEMLLAYPHLVTGQTSQVELPDWETGKTCVVEIDPELDAVKNAQNLFQRAKKARTHVEEARKEAEKLQRQYEGLATDAALVAKLEDPLSLKRFEEDRFPSKEKQHRRKHGKKHLPAYLRYDLEDCVIFVGLSAKGNRHVTFDLASSNDIWFHAQDIPGSHVIIKAPVTEIPENVFLAAASLAAYYSKSDQLGNLLVDYTERRHVRHIRGSGPANVTFKNSASVRIDQNLWRKLLQEAE